MVLVHLNRPGRLRKGVLVGGSGGTSSGVGERGDYTPTVTEDDFLVCSNEIAFRRLRLALNEMVEDE